MEEEQPNSPTRNSKPQTPDETTAPPEPLPYPLDFVVHHINQAVQHQQSDDSEDEAVLEVNYELKKEGFKIKNKDYGADFEFSEADGNENPKPTSSTAAPSKLTGSAKFRKGHRRAWSMPNAKDKAVLVVAEDSINDDGQQKRHVVRYRLHPYRLDDEKTNDAVNLFIQASNFDIELPLDDDDIDLDDEGFCFPGVGPATKGTRSVMKRVWEATWKAQNFDLLPTWLQDNEYLRTGHRPPLPSFASCFQSIFKLHTETGNIWTHLYGCLAFVGLGAWFLCRPSWQVPWLDKMIFSFFFLGAVCCLGLSCSFHTVQCHSVSVGKLFSKLDYSGITMLIVGSFIPWIYYGFYCRTLPMIFYITMITIMGFAALVVSLWDKFAEPAFRPVRAGVFVTMGLSAVVPAAHMLAVDGIYYMFEQASLHWLLLMAFFYLAGAAIYASRFPERFFPGKCDYVFQSHQLFHTFVVIAAYIHFHGIAELAAKRLGMGSCTEQMIERFGADNPSIVDYYLRPY
jgi:adiponectin receptor